VNPSRQAAGPPLTFRGNEKEEMDMKSLSLVATVLLAACISNTAALAQEDHGTMEQQAACTPDAFRLCSNYIPDPAKVESCLRQRKLDLGDACRSVFEQRATTARSEANR